MEIPFFGPTQAKSKKKKASRKIGIDEPIRKSLYDMVIENMKEVDRKTFLHRLIYIGRHSFGKLDELALPFFTLTVSAVNAAGTTEPLTGFYLHYHKHFVHIVEGDEAGVFKHLNFVFSSEYFKYLHDLKVLVDLWHITERLIPEYSNYSGCPKKLLDPPLYTPTDTVNDTARHIFKCVAKIYQLLGKMHRSDATSVDKGSQCMLVEEPTDSDKDNSKLLETTSSVMSANSVTRYSSMRLRSVTSLASSSPRISPFRDFLPEAEIIEYLIESPFTQHLRDYYNLWGYAPIKPVYKDRVWPIPSDFIQYDVFELPYNRVFDMFEKTGKKKKEGGEDLGEEEEEEEEVEV